jgi:glycosyltransferase involved in cell wall biosynthesis
MSWLSNAPWSATGYGQQTRILTPKIRDYGVDIAITATYGLGGDKTTWEGMTVYPQGFDSYGNDIAVEWALDHFQGDPNAGWLWLFYDAWVFRNPAFANVHTACWAPVDHKPLPPPVARFFNDFNAVPVAMSKFGVGEFAERDLEALYVPHCYDPAYEPKPSSEGREVLGIPDDVFVVGMSGANKGRILHRKGFSQAFEGFARFHKTHPDSVLYVHTEKTGYEGTVGWNLERLAQAYGIGDSVVFADQHAYKTGVPVDAMPWVYSAFDVFVNASYGGGFEIPLIEAQACGVPVVATDFTAMSELVFDGWKVRGLNMWHEEMGAWWKIPSPGEIGDALTEAYNRTGPSQEAVDGVAEYAADRVFTEHMVPVLENLRERINA